MAISSNDLIPRGWYRLMSGLSQEGDKYWSYEMMAWLPVTVNGAQSQKPVNNLDDPFIVIRKDSNA